MSFSLAKKNIKHKRKTMKRKQKGGYKIGIGRMSFTVPYTSNTSKKDPNFTDTSKIDEGTTGTPPITETRPTNDQSKNFPPAEQVALDAVKNSATASTDQTTTSSEAALVATLAAAIHQLPCDIMFKTIEAKLEKKNIKSISKKQKKRLTNLGAATFDANASAIEKGEAIVKTIKNITFAIETLGTAVPSGATALIGIAQSVGVAASKYNKHLELIYLSSQCLIYISNISRDLAEIHSFYNDPTVISKGIKMDSSLHEILVKSLFTFTYFLIDNIDFTSKISGLDQYQFWFGFLSRIDFSNTEKIEKDYIYKYSCRECIPDELREKLKELSVSGKPYKKIIDFDDVFDNRATKTKYETSKKKSYFSFSKSRDAAMSVVYKPRQIFSGINDRISSKHIEIKDTDTNGNKLFGFCGNNIVEQCTNYNDIIMRLIEFNIYKLFKTTYENKNLLPINFEGKSSGITSEDFYKYIFEEDEINVLNILYKSEGSNSRLDDEEEKKLAKATLFDQKSYDKMIYSDEEKLEEFFCIEFLFELKRIIKYLSIKTMFDKYIEKVKYTTSQSSSKPSDEEHSTMKSKFMMPNMAKGAVSLGKSTMSSMSSIRKSAVSIVKTTLSVGSVYFGDPEGKYDTFLREYVIMTGNFATILSRYSLDHNKLSVKDKTEILENVNKEVARLNKSLKVVNTVIIDAARKGETAAKNIEALEAINKQLQGEGEGEGEAGTGTGTGPESASVAVTGVSVTGGKLIHNRLKKHTKKYKHYNDYKHYKSKKIRRNKRK
jgi:hypothetical protein